jgi:hypothetical protein
MEAFIGFLFVVAVAALAVYLVIRREKKLGNDIVQDVKDLGE